MASYNHKAAPPNPATNPLVSIITPAYNEALNVPLLYERLKGVLNSLGENWEWLVVDDHSRDTTFEVASALAEHDRRVRVFRFSRNYGSHTAILCGLDHARGDCVVVMAADLQDPPETIPQLVSRWRGGEHIVWAVRNRREGEKRAYLFFARLYYAIMRYVVGLRDMPTTGADFFLADRKVVDALRLFREANASLMALIHWMGFRQGFITYDKRARERGRSGWNLGKRVKLVVDSITAFSFLPIRFMSSLGMIVALMGFGYATLVFFNALSGKPPQGWASLMVVLLILGGLQMIMLGVLGEYVWRALDEARRRPRYVLERVWDRDHDPGFQLR